MTLRLHAVEQRKHVLDNGARPGILRPQEGTLMNISPSEVAVVGSVFLFVIWVISYN